MRKLVYYVAVSVDGFIAGPAGEVDSFVSVGDHMTRMIEDHPETVPLDIWLCGGGALAGQVAEEIDEFRLKVNPVLFGDGIPMLASRTSQADHSGRTGLLALPLRQRSRTDCASGVSYVEYVRN